MQSIPSSPRVANDLLSSLLARSLNRELYVLRMNEMVDMGSFIQQITGLFLARPENCKISGSHRCNLWTGALQFWSPKDLQSPSHIEPQGYGSKPVTPMFDQIKLISHVRGLKAADSGSFTPFGSDKLRGDSRRRSSRTGAALLAVEEALLHLTVDSGLLVISKRLQTDP